MTATVTTAEARAQFSRIADHVRATGQPVTVFKHSRPWVVIGPAEPGAIEPDDVLASRAEARDMLRRNGSARYSTYTDLIAAMRAADAES
jgi:prevent-host-death family protein